MFDVIKEHFEYIRDMEIIKLNADGPKCWWDYMKNINVSQLAAREDNQTVGIYYRLVDGKYTLLWNINSKEKATEILKFIQSTELLFV